MRSERQVPVEANILAICRDLRLALTDLDETIPIVSMFDDEGSKTEETSEAVSFSAGPDSRGLWFADVFSSYGEGVSH